MVEDDDEDVGGSNGGPLRTQNEIEPPPPPRPDIAIDHATPIAPFGVIQSIVKQPGANYITVIIMQNTHQESRPLDIGSIIVLEDRTILGEVFETFGPVVQPLYTIRLATDVDANNEIKMAVGTLVYYLPTHTQFVLTQELRKLKGSDASNYFDEEVAEDVSRLD
ncbi:H/ACA ribonucleoprotein complex, subunit Gar1/Naf1 [Syncephalis plumigaleata]|nr:H/ACA ribonucleoprotein complex, subunit Gar1/Naf1 [Syncephalis plumigaleata]